MIKLAYRKAKFKPEMLPNMIKQMTQFKVIVNDLECNFYFESTANTVIAKEACLACLKWIGNIEDVEKARIESEKVVEQSEEKKDDQPSV